MVSEEYLDESYLTIDFGDITKKGGFPTIVRINRGKNTFIFAITTFPTSVGNVHLKRNVYI